MSRRYFEDLSVGDTWDSRALTLSEDEMIGFAKAYDPQPMHVDPEAALLINSDGRTHFVASTRVLHQAANLG